MARRPRISIAGFHHIVNIGVARSKLLKSILKIIRGVLKLKKR